MSKLLSYSKISGFNHCAASAYANELLSNKVTKAGLRRLGLPLDVDIEVIERRDTEATVYGKVGHELIQSKLKQPTEDTRERFTSDDILFANPDFKPFMTTPKKGQMKKKFVDLVDVAENMVELLSRHENSSGIYKGKVEEHLKVGKIHGYIDYILPETGKIVDFKFLSEARTFDGEDWWAVYELQAKIYSWLNYQLNGTIVPVLYQAYLKKEKRVEFHEFKFDIDDLSVIEVELKTAEFNIKKQRVSKFLWRCDHPFCQYCRATRALVYKNVPHFALDKEK